MTARISRKGYRVERQQPTHGGQETIMVTRVADEVGLGAYATPEQVDQAITDDRAWLAAQ